MNAAKARVLVLLSVVAGVVFFWRRAQQDDEPSDGQF